MSSLNLTTPIQRADNHSMVALLEGQIDVLGKQVDAFPRGGERAQLREGLDQAISLALCFFNVLQSEVEQSLKSLERAQ